MKRGMIFAATIVWTCLPPRGGNAAAEAAAFTVAVELKTEPADTALMQHCLYRELRNIPGVVVVTGQSDEHFYSLRVVVMRNQSLRSSVDVA
jgi:hypothetical protein